MLEDIQERMVYRTHIYMNEEILGYNPSPGDLTYPQKLEIMAQIADSIKKNNESMASDSDSSLNDSFRSINNRANTADAHGMWYPTLRRTLICLSKLQRCVEV